MNWFFSRVFELSERCLNSAAYVINDDEREREKNIIYLYETTGDDTAPVLFTEPPICDGVPVRRKKSLKESAALASFMFAIYRSKSGGFFSFNHRLPPVIDR